MTTVPAKAIDLGIAIEKHNAKKRGRKPGKLIRGLRCGNCKRIGHNKKTCPGIGKSEDGDDVSDSQEKEWGEPLSRKQWSDVKIAFVHNMTSVEIAKNMEVDLQEVNLIQRCSTYDMYLGRRDSNKANPD